MEIINPISEILIAFSGITALVLMTMLFTYFLGGLMASLFEG